MSGRRRRRGVRRRPPDPLHRARRRRPVLGPAPPQGGAAAVVTDDPAGRLLELAVTDLALIERVRLALGAGPHRASPARPAPASPCSSTRSGWCSGRAPTRGSCGTGPRRRGSRRCSTAMPEPLIWSARSPPRDARRRASTTRRSPPRGSPRPSAGSSRSTVSTSSSGCSTSGPARPARRVRWLLGRSRGRCRGGRALAAQPGGAGRAESRSARARAAARAGRARVHEIDAAGLRPGEVDEIQARLGAARHGEAIARGGVAIREALLGDESGVRDRLGPPSTRSASWPGSIRASVRWPSGWPASRRARGRRGRGPVAGRGPRPRPDRRRAARGTAVADLRARAALSATTRRPCSPTARRWRPRPTACAGSRASAIAGWPTMPHGWPRSPTWPRRCPGCGARPQGGWPRRSRRRSASSASPDRLRGRRRPAPRRAGRAGGRGRGRRAGIRCDRGRRGRLPARAEPGRAARPLARIASGGELSRVALAIKEVLAAADATPTLVFDEVDAGIGGRCADPVGRSLWPLARDHQVLCVTHLPQIAAHADVHLQIAKRERDGRTVTEVQRARRRRADRRAGPDARRRCRRGRRRSAGARELLERAAAWRQGIGGGRAGRPGMSGRQRGAPDGLVAAIDAYLDHLRVERGLAAGHDPGLRLGPGWRSPGRPGVATGWSSTAEPALAISPVPPPPPADAACAARRPRSAPSTGSPSAEELIAVDVAGRLDLPRQVAPAARDARRRRGRAAARRPRGPARRADRHPRPGAARAALRVRPAHQRGARPRPRGPVARRRLRAGHRQGRPRAARAGRRGRPRRLERYLDDVRPIWLARQPREPVRGGPLFLSARGRRLGRQAGVGDRARAAATGPGCRTV